MKTTKIVFAFICATLFLSQSIAQQTENQLWYVHKFQVNPDKIENFKTFYKEYNKASNAHNKQHAFYVFRSLSPIFYQFQRVKDFNGAGDLGSEFWQIMGKMDESHTSKLFESVESWHGFFIKSIDSLSYYPEGGPLIGEDLLYAEWWINHIETGKMSVYAKTFDKANKKTREAEFNYPIGRFEVSLGMEKPAIISVFWGKGVADLYENANKAWESLGTEVQGMINDFNSSRRKFEKIPMWYEADLSYTVE